MSGLAGLVAFVSISAVWFYNAPLLWIYAISNALALRGDENTLDLLLISGWLVALLPALLAFIYVYRLLK
ncbi:hypothetical protein C3432_18060 [Citrobacter amalonaticus]|uniref:Uncharacterized protein n=2 Tax=Citrobacter amalonaticus TaxID=35703 RepID=A0A2S4RWV7_CITAM|nr:hypothetical protein C3432_18060 [Citrobacter amalonaticus]POT74203.1 hypothetical protein C3436_15700 [Citrobacter amalonaticus]POU65004.1 hypothetical protein C3430_12440 [Citrobacter amalonaticus]POV03838.1 hypothetical protein C3424_17380 [Citrobacter amalonaticus]